LHALKFAICIAEVAEMVWWRIVFLAGLDPATYIQGIDSYDFTFIK
jgi:hypothetical protein